MQQNPYCHVDYWTSFQEEVLNDHNNDTIMDLTTAKDEEVFELDRDKRKRKLYLEEQIQT